MKLIMKNDQLLAKFIDQCEEERKGNGWQYNTTCIQMIIEDIIPRMLINNGHRNVYRSYMTPSSYIQTFAKTIDIVKQMQECIHLYGESGIRELLVIINNNLLQLGENPYTAPLKKQLRDLFFKLKNKPEDLSLGDYIATFTAEDPHTLNSEITLSSISRYYGLTSDVLSHRDQLDAAMRNILSLLMDNCLEYLYNANRDLHSDISLSCTIETLATLSIGQPYRGYRSKLYVDMLFISHLVLNRELYSDPINIAKFDEYLQNFKMYDAEVKMNPIYDKTESLHQIDMEKEKNAVESALSSFLHDIGADRDQEEGTNEPSFLESILSNLSPIQEYGGMTSHKGYTPSKIKELQPDEFLEMLFRKKEDVKDKAKMSKLGLIALPGTEGIGIPYMNESGEIKIQWLDDEDVNTLF